MRMSGTRGIPKKRVTLMGLQIRFTKDGESVGPAQAAPAGADDLEIGWRGRGCKVVVLFTTKEGGMLGHPLVAPSGTNDFHITFVGRKAGVEWTHNGEPVGDLVPFPDFLKTLRFYIYSDRWRQDNLGPLEPEIQVPHPGNSGPGRRHRLPPRLPLRP
jgi:hypothetical protein